MNITVTEEDRSVAKYELINESNVYLREVHDCLEDGYRPHYCFHGTNLWTDYDNICGPCEDSQYDPRWHSIGGQEFNERVEARAIQIARTNRYDLILRMIKEDAQNLYTRHDLAALKIKIDLALDLYN